jgi:hypothetical protein
MKAGIAGLVALALVLTACGDAGGGGTGPDLEIERRIGYAVIVNDSGLTLEIGFNADRDAESGEAFDLTDALWRVEDGPWNEPPVTCVGKGQRVELGLASVQNETRPGLLHERVVWLSCLASADG